MASSEARLRLVIEALDRTGGTFASIIGQAQNVGGQITAALNSTSTGASKDPFSGLRTTVSLTRAELEKFYTDEAARLGKVLGSDIPIAAALSNADLATFYGRVKDVKVAVAEANPELSTMQRMLAFQSLAQASAVLREFGDALLEVLGQGVERSAEAEVIGVNLANALRINLDPAVMDGATVSGEKLTETLGALSKRAEEIGLKTMFSDVQIMQVMEHLVANGIAAQTVLEGGAQSVAYLAQATKTELQPTVETLTAIMHSMSRTLASSFGEDTEQALGSVADVLTNLKLTTGASLTTIGNTMKYVGPIADEFGMRFQDIGTAVDLLFRAGIRGSQAGTSLRRMLTNLTPTSDAAAEAMAQLGLIASDGSNKFFDAAGKMKPLAEVQRILYESMKDLTDEQQVFAVKTIFGQYALQSMMKIVSTTPAEFQSLAEKVNQSGTAMRMGAEQMETYSGKVDVMVENVNIAKKKLGDSVKDSLKPVLDIGASVAAMYAGLSPEVHRFVAVSLGVIGTIATVVGTIGGAVAAFGLFSAGLAAAGISMTAFLSTAGIVLGVIAAVAAAAYLLYVAWDTNFMGIRDLAADVWKSVKWEFENAIASVQRWWDSIAPTVQQAWANVEPILQTIIAVFKHLFGTQIKSVWNTFVDVIKVAWDFATGIIEGGWKVISGVFQVFVSLLAGDWEGLWDGIKRVAEGFWTIFETLWEGFWSLLFTILKNVLRGIVELFGFSWDDVVASWESFKSNFGKAWDDFWSDLKAKFKLIGQLITGDWEGALDTFASITGYKKEDIVRVVVGLVDEFTSIFISLPNKAATWASNMIDSFVNGIKAKVQAVRDAVGDVSGSIKDFLGFSSPTKEGAGRFVEQWMPNMMQTLVDGIEAHRGQFRAAVSRMAMDLDVGLNGGNVQFAGVPGGASRTVVVNNYFTINGRAERSDVDEIARAVRRSVGVVNA